MCNPMAGVSPCTGQEALDILTGAKAAPQPVSEKPAEGQQPTGDTGPNPDIPGGVPRILLDFMPTLLSAAMSRMFAARIEDGAADLGHAVTEGRLLSDPNMGSNPAGSTNGTGYHGFKTPVRTPDPVDVIGTTGLHGAGPLTEGKGLYERAVATLDDDASLTSEAQYLAQNLHYEAVSRSSGAMGNAAAAVVVLGAVVMVAAIAFAPATGGGSLAFAAL